VRTVSAAIRIAAPPMTVWAVLTDLGRYPEWNPLIRAATGEIAVGKRLTMRAVQPGGRLMTIRPRILAAEPGVELRWIASLPGIIGGEHSFRLRPGSAGTDGSAGTELVQSETYRGLLVPVAGKLLAGNEAGFRALNEAIRKQAEARPEPG
jgi:hypothetical protein